jgi:OHCU decarboxylase
LSLSVTELDAMSESDAAQIFRSCCGASRWVDRMTARRPFRTRDAVFSVGDEEWSRCTEKDWLEAVGHHPRIGDTAARGAASEEQSGTRTADEHIREALAEVNRAYERKFGHIYIVCATGKSAEEMLDIARSRMVNDAETELALAAEEQRKIMQLRLRKLLGDDS